MGRDRLSRWTLRADGLFLMVVGAVAMLTEIVGHFLGRGPLAATQGSPYTIGGVEAHGLAVLIGALLLRAAGLSDRGLWHRVGLATHLLLGSSNLLFWSSFLQQNLLAVGIVTTVVHLSLVVAHALCLRSGGPAAR